MMHGLLVVIVEIVHCHGNRNDKGREYRNFKLRCSAKCSYLMHTCMYEVSTDLTYSLLMLLLPGCLTSSSTVQVDRFYVPAKACLPGTLKSGVARRCKYIVRVRTATQLFMQYRRIPVSIVKGCELATSSYSRHILVRKLLADDELSRASMSARHLLPMYSC